MKTMAMVLEYGEDKVVKINGKILRASARAVDAGNVVPNAELLLLTDDSVVENEIRLFYCENGRFDEYVFYDVNSCIHDNENLLDVIPFFYVVDGKTKTGVVVVEKVVATTTNELSEAFR